TSTTTNTTPGAMVYLTYPGATPVPGSTIAGNWSSTIGTAGSNYTNGTDSDYHVIGDQVYRLEISFLLTDGTIAAKPILTHAASILQTWSASTYLTTSGIPQAAASRLRVYQRYFYLNK